jgi:hypothetical protein
MSFDTEQLDPLAGMDKVDGEEYATTLTGFDELAIERAFGRSLDKLPALTTMRALLFIRLRREGAKDHDAFRTSMELRLGRLEEVFVKPRKDQDEDEGDAPGEA